MSLDSPPTRTSRHRQQVPSSFGEFEAFRTSSISLRFIRQQLNNDPPRLATDGGVMKITSATKTIESVDQNGRGPGPAAANMISPSGRSDTPLHLFHACSRHRGTQAGPRSPEPRDAIERLVRLAGIEPATSGSTIRRSNQLSYNRTRCLSAKGPYGLTEFNSRRFGRQNAPVRLREEAGFQTKKRPAGGGAGLFLLRAGGRRCRLVTPKGSGRRCRLPGISGQLNWIRRP